jgi:conjugal transfer mating pair stabilization protein TraG
MRLRAFSSYLFTSLPFCLLTFFLPTTSHAAYEIVTYGNGEFIGEVLNSIAIIAGGGDLRGLLRLGLLIGLLVAVLSAMFQRQFNPAWFIWAVIIYMAFFGVKVNVAIEDKLNPSANRVIGDVPMGVGLFAYGTSKIGDGLTRLMETAFTLPGSLKYSTNGYLQGADLMRRSTNFIIPEPHLRRSFISFIRNCTFYDILDGSVSQDTILKSSNLLNALATNSTRYAEIYTSSSCEELSGFGDVLLCRDAYPRLKTCINSYYPQWKTTLEKAIFGIPTGTLESILGDSYSYLANLSFTARDVIIQNALINTFGDAFKAQAAATGADATLLAIAVAEAQAQQKSAFVVMGEMAKKTLPVIRGLIQGMLYGIFPIMLFLMMTPWIGRVFPTYLGILLWTELWNPIYAIVNLFANLSMKRALPGIVDGELSIMTNPALQHEAQTAIAVAGLATVIVPFIAYFIVSQSHHAIVGAIGQMMSPTTGLGQSAGASTSVGNVSLGNMSLGNASWNNISANKDDRTAIVARGSVYRYSGYGDGPAYEWNVGSMPFGLMARTDTAHQIAERVSELKSSALQNVKRSAESLSATISDIERVGNSWSTVRNMRTGETHSLSSEEASSLSRLNSIADRIQQETGVDRRTAITQALTALGARELGLSAGLGGSMGGSGSGGLGISGKTGVGIKGGIQSKEGWQDSTQMSESLERAINSANQNDYRNVMSIAERFGKSQDLSTSTQSGTFGGSERVSNISQAKTYMEEASRILQEAQTLERSSQISTVSGFSETVNLTPEFLSRLSKHGVFYGRPAKMFNAIRDWMSGNMTEDAWIVQSAYTSFKIEKANEAMGGAPTIAAGVGIFFPNRERIKGSLSNQSLSEPEGKGTVTEFGKEGRESTSSSSPTIPESLGVDERITGTKGKVEEGQANIQKDRGEIQSQFVDEKTKARDEAFDFKPSISRATTNAGMGFDPEHGKRMENISEDPYTPSVYRKEIETLEGRKTILGVKPQEKEMESLKEKRVVVPEEYRNRNKEQ